MTTNETNAAGPKIDLSNENDLATWAKKLDAGPEQIREAVQAVGSLASDVEQHLKGTRSTTNAEQTRAAVSVGTR